MAYESMIYTFIVLISWVVLIVTTFFSWKKRPADGATQMTFLLLAILFWSFSDLISSLAPQLWQKQLFYNLKFIGIVSVGPAWIAVALSYNKLYKYLNIRNLILILIIPAFSLVMVWTNDFHKLFISKSSIIKVGSFESIYAVPYIFFWINMAYSYLLLGSGIALFIAAYFRLASIHKKQSLILILAAFFPLIANCISVFEVVRLPYNDITPMALFVTGVCCFWGLFRYNLLDIVPIAHKAVVEGIKDPVIVLDNSNRLMFLNMAAMKIFSIAEDSIGLKAEDLYSEWPQIFKNHNLIQNENNKIQMIVEGEDRHFEVGISPLKDNKNNISGRIVVLSETTQIEKAVRAANEASKSKGQFLANMSHEIRTPMNAIIASAELLASTNLNSEQNHYTKIISNSGEHLLSVINNILDISKVEAGMMELNYTEFSISELVEEIQRILSLKAKEKGIKLLINETSDIPIVFGDKDRLRQVIINLLGNSIKFTDKGVVEIKVKVVEWLADNKIKIGFEISDTGIGISEGSIKNLFKPFVQVDGSSTRKFGGTGLGLSISKSLIELMQGEISVESRVGEGSRFYFIIDFIHSGEKFMALDSLKDDSELKNESKKNDLTSLNNIKILLVEDNPVNRNLANIQLNRIGITDIKVAVNGLEAIEYVKNERFDVVLMDCQMPIMDGYQATEEIRKQELGLGEHVIIIAMTANALKGDEIKCIDAGMDDYLSKPVKIQFLKDVLCRNLKVLL